MSRDFFISYTRPDLAWAEWIATALELAGFQTLLQARDFRYGDNFVTNMDEGIRTYRHTLALLSPAYLRSPFTTAEWTAAYRKALLGKPRALIPVRVDPCGLDGLLGTLSYVDLVDAPQAEARRRLLDATVSKLPRRSTMPPFPGRSS